MSEIIKIAIDAMGGDFAPDNEIDGAILAASENKSNLHLILTGDEKFLAAELNKRKNIPSNISIVNASEVITMDDSPSETFKTKPDSSLAVALNLVKSGKANGCISAGNTGAVLFNSTFKLGRLDKVGRPTIGSIFPTTGDITMVFDVGASVDCKPIHLFQYAIMGSMYMDIMYGIKNPSVGLLNVGEEKSKGDELTIKTYELLSNSKLNFIGNVEGRDILKGKCNVVICDGFVGNVILKFAESVLDFLKTSFKNYADESVMKKIKVGMMRGTMKDVLKRFDYQNYGGVPLLGVKGISIIGHGKSSPLAIKNMIMKAVEVHRKDLINRTESELRTINFSV